MISCNRSLSMRVGINVGCTVALLLQPSLGALRASESSSYDLPSIDPANCHNDAILHDMRLKQRESNPDEFLESHLRRMNDWYQNDYLVNRAPGTFVNEDILLDIPVGGSFMFTGQKAGEYGMTTPVLQMSAWHEDSEGSIVAHEESYSADTYTWNFVHPDQVTDVSFDELRAKPLRGDYVVLMVGWYYVYQHLIIDHLGYLVYLSQTLPPETKILIPGHHEDSQLLSIIQDIDPQLASRIEHFNCAGVYNDPSNNHKLVLKRGSLKILTPKSLTRHVDLYTRLRSWLWNSLPNHAARDSTVIYYTREGHKRHMEPNQESIIIELINETMQKFNRREKLVVFDGRMSFIEQVKLFQSASVVIGPHGGGLANVLFTRPSDSCENRPKLLEFITNPETPKVQKASLDATYYTLYSTAPWLDFHQVLFRLPSGRDDTYIELDAFQEALHSIFSDELHSTEMN